MSSVLCYSSRPLTSEWREIARSASPETRMRREWRSVDTFLSVQSSYPSDWGLPRIALAPPGQEHRARLGAREPALMCRPMGVRGPTNMKTDDTHYQRVL